jgi:hypothetical protein
MQGLACESVAAAIAAGETSDIDFYGNCHIVVARMARWI